MVNKRKKLGLVILATGIVISILIIIPRDAGKRSLAVSSKKSEGNPALSFKSSDNENLELNLPEKEKMREEDFTENTNLTEALADSYVRQLLNNSVDGSLPSEEDVFAELQKNLPQSLIYSTFKEEDVKVSSDNSEKNQITYMEAVNEAMWNNFGELQGENTGTAIEKFFKEDNSSIIEKLIKAAPNYLDDLLQIEAPSAWKEFHLAILNVWQKKFTVYKAVVDYDSDPSKAYLALQELPDIIQRSQDLQLILIQRYNELTDK